MLGRAKRNQLENKLHFSKVLNDCQCEKLITKDEKDAISKKVKDNKNLMESGQHLVMTTKKFEYAVSFGTDETFINDIIYTDEVYQGMLTHIPKNTVITVYAGAVVELEATVSINHARLLKLKRCLITVEDNIVHELNHLKFPFKRISKPVKTYDPNLEIAIVRSTSSNPRSDNPNDNKISDIFNGLKKIHGDNVTIISDGLSESGCKDNHTSTKGQNNHSNGNNIAIMSYPSPQELACAIFCTGLDEEKAIRLIMSDKFNQAVGRNMGYRNKVNGVPSKGDNHCLVVMPKNLYLDMHNVTNKVTRVSHWNSTNRSKKLTEDNRSLFHFREAIEELANVTKADNQENVQTTSQLSDQYSNIIYYVFEHTATHGSKRISLKEIHQDTGIPLNVVRKLCKNNMDVLKSRSWDAVNDSKLQCVKLDNCYV